ncbi:hypothetical protein TRFO_41868 [Tritrichomonas foetus]|uniref:Uncharacterized protein n=1 Tax=Tritrichomonas foetus TaxID=1144522 RepID=A0A1J4L2Y1_9EUKA|nr:hypothetical protein TRFO_41868 [Tritrichomonas foetus]|eukprot:OHT16332.1 hypothetical protein TRFO_41868 [Tritrichomonas foetus]
MSDESKLQKVKEAFFDLDVNRLQYASPFLFLTRQIKCFYNENRERKSMIESQQIDQIMLNAAFQVKKTKLNKTKNDEEEIEEEKIDVVDDPEKLFTSEKEVVYYLPPTVNEQGIDAAYKGIINEKMTIILLQFTVSDYHSFHMGVFEYFIDKIAQYQSKVDLEFCVVTPHINKNFKFDQLKGYCTDSKNSHQKAKSYKLLKVGKRNVTSLFCQYTQRYIFRHVSQYRNDNL